MPKLTQKQVAVIRIKQGKFPRSTEVQSVILTKNRGMTRSGAIKKISNAGFKTTKIDITQNTFRFRQRPPSAFVKKTFRTKTIKPGLKIVIGVPR